MKKKEPFIINRLKSVGFAFKGMLILIKTEASIKIQLCIAIVVTCAGFYFEISKIDYLKCDIEGYEEFVIPEIKEIIRQHKPIIQIEMGKGVKEIVEEVLNEIGYNTYFVSQDRLLSMAGNDFEPGDILYLPKDREGEILKRLAV